MPTVIVLVIVFLALTGLFILVVGPLFTVSGPARADLAAELPAHASPGRPLEIDVAFDNTGDSLISPVCVGIAVTGPLHPQYAVFLGIDQVPVKDGAVCGGGLAGGNTVSIRLVMTATAPGTATYRLTPMQGRSVIGRSLSAAVSVSG